MDSDSLDPAEAEEAARLWVEWAAFDLEHFIEPIARGTGLTRSEVLLYLVSERLGQLADQGLKMRGTITHEVKPLKPPPDPGEEWKA